MPSVRNKFSIFMQEVYYSTQNLYFLLFTVRFQNLELFNGCRSGSLPIKVRAFTRVRLRVMRVRNYFFLLPSALAMASFSSSDMG